ncbi:MAG: hypothetical protein MUO94_07255 [Thermoplasmata archaeon]|nr:hypothetical protein [Thermoplasmata archaeon]
MVIMMLGLTVLPASVAAGSSDDTGTRPDSPGSPPNANRDRPVTVGFELNQSVIFGEYYADDLQAGGMYVDGSTFPIGEFTTSYGDPITSMMYSAPDMESVHVTANWSDNLILHQFTTGTKIRTEVVLWSEDYHASVYSVRASFSIVPAEMGEDGKYVPIVGEDPIFSGNVSNGLWNDGVADNVYSAEVNQVGCLLYGYNWDEKTLGSVAGTYMLKFTLDPIEDFEMWGLTGEYEPPNYPYAGSQAGEIVIDGVDDDKFDPQDPSYAVKEIGFDAYSTWVVVELV